jgi:chromosome segregation ATPase
MTDASDPAALRAEIDEERAALADTAQELAAKADVKARVRERAAAVTDQAMAVTGQAKEAVSAAVDEVKDAGRNAVHQFSGPPADIARRPVPWALVAAVATGVAIGWLVWRRRS